MFLSPFGNLGTRERISQPDDGSQAACASSFKTERLTSDNPTSAIVYFLMPTCHSIQLRLAPPITSPHRPLGLIAQACCFAGVYGSDRRFGTGSKLWNAPCQDQTSQMVAIPKASSSFRSRSAREPGAAAPRRGWHRRPRRSRPPHRFLGRRHPLINVHSIGSRPQSLPRPRVGADCRSRGDVTASGDAARHPRRQGTARAD